MSEEVKAPKTVAEAIAQKKAKDEKVAFERSLATLTSYADHTAKQAELKATQAASSAIVAANHQALFDNIVGLTTDKITPAYASAVESAYIVAGYSAEFDTKQKVIDNYGEEQGALIAELLNLS